jgi:hypothetical protein
MELEATIHVLFVQRYKAQVIYLKSTCTVSYICLSKYLQLINLTSQGSRKITVDHIVGDAFVTAAIIRHGLVPCSPYTPTAAFTLRVLEFYRVSHNRCPHFSIHAFVKTLCDLHSSPYKAYLNRQFSISYDLYLRIRAGADQRVQIALKRNTPNWRLRHICPPCTYQLEDEPKLKFSMLYTVDGNDSLKRIIRRDEPPPVTEIEEDVPSHQSHPILGASSESTDTREIGTGLYLTNEQVDEWSKETLAALFPIYNEEENVNNPCAERWRNMRTTLTAKMWGVFQETGLFLALCRHGFVLLLADMVRSGEL